MLAVTFPVLICHDQFRAGTPLLEHLMLAGNGLVSVASKSAGLSNFSGAADGFVAGFRTCVVGESSEDFLCLGKIERSLVRAAL